jgi:hypothetical protein
MNPKQAAAAADTAWGMAPSPSPRLDVAWADPALGRLFHRQRRLQGLDRRYPRLLDRDGRLLRTG